MQRDPDRSKADDLILALGFFCEEVKTEPSGALSAIGIFPENVVSDRFPANIPKLTAYVRAVLPLPMTVTSLRAEILLPGIAKAVAVNEVSYSDLEAMLNTHRLFGDPSQMTVTLQMQATNVPLIQPGRATLEMLINGRRHTCCALNLRSSGTRPSR